MGRVETGAELFGELVQAAILRPDKTPDRLTVLSLSDEEQDRLFTPKRLELLRVLRDRGEGELTISELARLLGRRLDVISRDLQVLARHGVVELEKVGRTKRVHLAADWILLHLETA